jgi:hypothetical protein
MNKHANKQHIIPVTEAEATLSRFEAERLGVVERKTALADKRRQIAFDALSGDKSASKLLDGLHREAVELESRLVSVNDAIAEAQRRLAAAREHEQREANKQRALQMRQVLGRFVEAGNACDKALAVLVAASQQLRESCTELNKLGAAYPSHSQLDSLGSIALRTALTQTAWVRYFERVSPMEAKTFGQLIGQWSATVERNSIAPVLADAEPATSDEAV